MAIPGWRGVAAYSCVNVGRLVSLRQNLFCGSGAGSCLPQNAKPAAVRSTPPRVRPDPTDRRAAALPLNIGASLIVVLLLSLGHWGAIGGAVRSLASAVLG